MAKEVDDLRLDRYVERRDRFVGHEQLRLHRKRAGNGHALPLPAGELRRILVEIDRVEADVFHLERGLFAVVCARRGAAGDAQRLGDGLADGAPGIEAGRRVLEDHLPRGLQIGAVRAELRAVGHVDAVEENMPCVRPVEIHDAARGGRLAGAGLADEAENLAVPHGKRQIVHRADGQAAHGGEAVRQMLHGEQDLILHAGALPAAARPSARADRAARWLRSGYR